MLSRTSRPHAPWYIIPSNHEWFRNLSVSRILIESLESLEIELPTPTVDIDEIRRKLHTAQAKAAELHAAVEDVDD